MNPIVDQSKTPSEWVEHFAGRGLQISERSLRASARKHGMCLTLGREMLISPEQMDAIWKQKNIHEKSNEDGQ